VKPPLRTKSVGTKVSEAEFAMLEKRKLAAEAANKRGAGCILQARSSIG
jgi:hypothetical protein